MSSELSGAPVSIELAARIPLPASSASFRRPSPGLGADSLRNESALPPVDKGFAAWSFLTAAFFVEAIVWGFPDSFGTFLEAYLRDETYSSQKHAATLLPLIGSISSGLMYFSSPFIYPIATRFPEYQRASLWIGTAIIVGSLLAASFTTSVPVLVGLQGISYAIGGSILYSPTISYLTEWFVERRGLGQGIIFAGTAAGGLILPIVLPPLISKYGPSKTLRYLSIFIGVLLVPLLPFVKGRLPQARVRGPAPRGPAQREWMKDRSLWLLISANTAHGFAYFVPLIWLPTFATELNLNATKSSLVLALLNGASVFGRVTLGHLSDKFSPWALAFTTLLSTSVVTFILWGLLARNFTGLICFGIAFGAVAGGWPSMWTGFVKPIAKDDPFLTTNIINLFLFTRGLGNVLSTPIASHLYSDGGRATTVYGRLRTGFEVAGGKYTEMIVYVGICFTGATLISFVGWINDVRTRSRMS